MAIPKIGPFRILKFSVPTPEAERLFLESFTSTRQHFKESLDALDAGHLTLADMDFDTGRRTKRGEYSMADDTYDQLLGKLDDRKFAGVSDGLRSNLVDYYSGGNTLPENIRQQLARLVSRGEDPIPE
jgi:hypothetical protein